MQLCNMLESLGVTSEEGGELQPWRGSAATVAAAPPSAPRRPAAVTRGQSTYRASASGGQDPSPVPAAASCVSCSGRHARLLHDSCFCAAPPHVPHPEPSRALKSQPPVFSRAPTSQILLAPAVWEGRALLGLPPPPSSQILSHFESS